MRGLLASILAVALALWARGIFLRGDLPSSVAWRDGLWLLVLAAGIFVAAAPPPRRMAPAVGGRAPASRWAGRGLGFLALFLSALVTGLLYRAWTGNGVPPGWVLWAALTLSWLLVGAEVLLASAPTPPEGEGDGPWSPAKARSLLQRAQRIRRSTREAPPLPLPQRARRTWLLVLLLLAGATRLWGGPDGTVPCLPTECRALDRTWAVWQDPDLSALLASTAPLVDGLQALLLGPVSGPDGPDLALYRALGLLVALATVALAFGAGLQIQGGGLAVVGTLFLAWLPWHVELSRAPGPGLWLVLGLLATLALAVRAQRQGDPRLHGLVGLLAGLTAWTGPPPWSLALLLWFLAGPARDARLRLHTLRPLVVLALPRLALLLDPDPWFVLGQRAGERLQTFASGLLAARGEPMAWAGVLAVLGLAYTLRHWRWEPGRTLLMGWGLALFAVLASGGEAAVGNVAGLWLLSTLAAALAVDGVLRQAAALWRPVVAPSTWLRLAAVLLWLPVLVAGVQERMGGGPLDRTPEADSPPAQVDTGSLPVGDGSWQPGEGAPLPALPDLPVQPVWAVGRCGADDGPFQSPRGVVIDPGSGQVYVADPGGAQVVALDLDDGAPVRAIRDPNFQEPFDLDVDSRGFLYILDALAQVVFQVDVASGQVALVPVETAFYRPRGLAVDIFGMLVVADTGGARVVHTDSTGRVLAQFGGPDTALGRGQPVDALGTANGILWAVTGEDGRLWRLDTREGRVVVARSNTMEGPHLAGLATGAFFLTDPEGRRILMFDEAGVPLAQISGDGRWVRPVGLDVAEVGPQVLLAVGDAAQCQVSLWQVGSPP